MKEALKLVNPTIETLEGTEEGTDEEEKKRKDDFFAVDQAGEGDTVI